MKTTNFLPTRYFLCLQHDTCTVSGPNKHVDEIVQTTNEHSDFTTPHVELSDSRNLIVSMNHCRGFALGTGQHDIDEVFSRENRRKLLEIIRGRHCTRQYVPLSKTTQVCWIPKSLCVLFAQQPLTL